MGILTPTDGEISISGFTPHEAVSKWPGAIAYVPQDVSIFNGTVLSNIALGFAPQEVPELQINKSLEVAKLLDFVNSLPQGIHTEVGENGSSFSGGQRQRLGIARALFTNPKLLVLDEATSALDGDTEIQVASAIRGLKGKTTILMIAHRLSTVRDADAVVYMENGKAIAIGSFEEVRLKVPEFDKQATLMGL
jgi:ABC-type multidrug transport system fused ATPase/permease subunit